MKTRLYRFSPKLLMVLSSLLLIFSLCFLWSSIHFAMPTALLAIKKAEAEQGLVPRKWELCRPSLDYKSSNTSGQYYSRQGDEFYIAQGFKNDSHFWNDSFGPTPVTPYQPQFIGSNPIIEVINGSVNVVAIDNLILVATPDPTAARVVLRLNEQSADCTETAPGSGVWTGVLRFPSSAVLTAEVFAYDASGTLIGSTPA